MASTSTNKTKNIQKVTRPVYMPSDREEEVLANVYEGLDKMIEVRNKTYREFNDRTLKDFIDDSSKRLNSYVIPKDSQDKEEWQSNVALPTNRDKLKRMLAGFSLQVPDMEVKAYGENNKISINRADIAKSLIKGSYLQEENPVIENFWEAWECGGKGTVVKYEGYLKTRYKQKFIKSFDLVTARVEFDEKEVDVEDKCISLIVPLTEFFIRDFYIQDVQEQPSVAWVRYYEKDVFDSEFGKYPNAKYVLTGGQAKNINNQSFFYQGKWSGRAGEERIEIIRYYNKLKDEYQIAANGVVLLDAPLLWRVNGKKVYPFPKTIWEPFEGKHFFYGNSLPNVLMPQFDILCTLWNTVMDKEFRSLVKPLLVGGINQDAFDLEDELITNSTKISVEDVSQVKPMPVEGVSNSDAIMLQLVAGGIEESAPSLPSLMSKKKATAREIVIAEEKLREIKSVHHQMLVELWRQKYYLRLANIQMNYPQPRKIVEEGEEKEIYRTFIIPNVILEKDTKERGTLAVQFRNLSDEQKLKIGNEIAAEEEMMKNQGVSYKKVILSSTFLDDYRYHIVVIPESLHKTSLAKMQATVLEKMEAVAKLFPQIFVLNQEEYFSQLAKAYDEKPERFLENLQEAEQASGQMPQPTL